ncbi:MAG: DUF4365 domain-containing protein [Pleomorphochaeta sp.]
MSKNVIASESCFTGKIGEKIVESIFNTNKIICIPTQDSDFGEDLICDIFTQSQNNKASIKTSLTFRTQIKTTQAIKKDGYIKKTKDGFSISLKTSLVKLWCQSYYPIVLVLYDLSTYKGYWCFPIEQIGLSNLEKKTISIKVNSNNFFDDEGVLLIREKVEDYYNRIFKMDKAKYQCSIYPIWMPGFRFFTYMENNIIFDDNNTKSNLRRRSFNKLPSFLSSYNNCDPEGLVSCIEYTSKSKSLNNFIEDLNNYIMNMELTLSDKKWVSYVISPVEIISEMDNRRISNLTDWVCLSKLGNKIVSDFEYTYNIGKDYTYTKKVRATSDNQDLFIHRSGDFAVEIFSKGFYLFNHKKQSQHMISLMNKAFCVVDISKCNSNEVSRFSKWCDENDYNILELDQEKDKIAICHKSFCVGVWGTLLPGVLTWEDWDSLNYDSESFFKKIPYGEVLGLAEKQRIINKYFFKVEHNSDFCYLQYSELLRSDALCHDERLIRFVTYIKPIDFNKNKVFFDLAESDLKNITKSFKLFYDPYKDISDVILEIKPLLSQSSKDSIKEVEDIYHTLIKTLVKSTNQQKNMASFIKYDLNRWIPENIVCKY